MQNGDHTVLVVDDEPGILDIVQVNLEGHGFRVICAATGGEGLWQLKKAHPDLVVLDLVLPDMPGWDVLRRVEADAATAGTPVIVLTALASDADILRGLEQGAVDYLTKPFYPEDLVASVKLHLQVFDAALRQGRREALIAQRRRLVDTRSRQRRRQLAGPEWSAA